MRETKEKSKTVNVDLTSDTHHKLKIACAVKGITFSDAVEQALRAWTKTVVT